MKRTLGVRAEPRSVNWAVVEGTQDRPVSVASDTEVAPEDFSEAEVLSWVRKKILFILDHYQVVVVAVRYPEPKALGHNRDAARSRCRVEGVVLEVAASKGLQVFTATLNTISKKSGTPAKDLLAGDSLRNIDWSTYKPYVKEAVLVAYSVLGT